jgi:hypothetical protein
MWCRVAITKQIIKKTTDSRLLSVNNTCDVTQSNRERHGLTIIPLTLETFLIIAT